MSKSLQQHGLKEIYKLDTIKVEVTRRAGKFKFAFTGSPEQVVSAEKILAVWT